MSFFKNTKSLQVKERERRRLAAAPPFFLKYAITELDVVQENMDFVSDFILAPIDEVKRMPLALKLHLAFASLACVVSFIGTTVSPSLSLFIFFPFTRG